MILAFLDETGTPSFIKDETKELKWFGITAVLVHDSRLISVIEKINNFNRRISQKYEIEFEIHAREIANSKKEPYNSMKIEDKINLLKECLSEIENLDICICSVFIDKKKHNYWHGEHDFLIRVVENIFERIGKHQKSKFPNEPILVFYDQISGHLRNIIQQTFIERLQCGSRYVSSKDFIKDILFVNSKIHPPIQIADITGYIIRRTIEKRLDGSSSLFSHFMDELFPLIRPIIDKNPRNNEIYGAGIKIIERNDNYYGIF